MPPSRAYDPTHPNLLALPLELYYQILFFLDVEDIITLRKATCKHFVALTQDRGLWSTIFARLRVTQALPYSCTEFRAMSTTQAERALFIASKTEASFLQPRKPIVQHGTSSDHSHSTPGTSWRILAFITDRLILSVDSHRVIIWDTSPTSSSFRTVSSPSTWAHYRLQTSVGYVMHCSKLYIAVMDTHEGHRSVVVHSVSLPDALSGMNEDHDKRLHWEAEFPLGESETFKYMDPHSCRAVLYGAPTSICVVHWGDNNRRSTISIQSDDLDENWNGIISLRFCGPYVLCFRVRSVEAYPVPTDGPTPRSLPVFRHRFSLVSFRSISLSRVHVSHCLSGDTYNIFMLSNDVYQGMFHYRICVTTVPVPAMLVRILARGTIQMPEALPGISNTLEDIIRRTFFATWSLGSAGLRGVWVDRQRGNIDRRVVVFTTHPTRLRTETNEAPHFAGVGELVSSGDAVDEEQMPTMNGQVVHVIPSYDLRDDVTICAVSEWTGKVALGSRVGEITLL